MRTIFILIFNIISTTLVIGQIPQGYYFNNIIETKWQGVNIINNSGFFNREEFSLAIINNNQNETNDVESYWLFGKEYVHIISNKKTIHSLKYRVDYNEKTIVLFNNLDRICFHWLCVSNGDLVYFYNENNK